MKTSFAIYPETRGQHVHVRVFTGPDSEHRSLAGTLVFRMSEWIDFASMCERSDVEINYDFDKEKDHEWKVSPS